MTTLRLPLSYHYLIMTKLQKQFFLLKNLSFLINSITFENLYYNMTSAMKTYRYILYFFTVIMLLFCGSCSNSSHKKVHILVIHSYEETHEAYPKFNTLIAKGFKDKRIDAEIRTFYLDCEYYLEEPELHRMSTMLDTMSLWKPDIILVNEDQATYSLLKCGHPLVKQVPIVFAGVNYPNWELVRQYPNVTGFHDKIDFKKNIDAIESIRNKRIDISTVLDSTYLDKKIMADARQQLEGTYIIAFDENKDFHRKGYLRQQGFVFFTPNRGRDAQSEELFRLLNQYSDNKAFLFAKRDFTTVGISKFIESPSFTAINDLMGGEETIIGGYITPVSIQVDEEVDAAAQILKGKNPSDMPITESKKQFVFDWKCMKIKKISIDNLPENSHIINIPLKERYPVLWWGTIISTVIVFNTILVLLLIFYLRERKRKHRALQQLADEKETLALAIAGSDVYAWEIRENEYVHFEHAFWDSIGMKPRLLPTNEFTSFIKPEQVNRFLKSWKNRLISKKKIIQLQLDFNGKGYRWWELRYSTTKRQNGESRTAGILLDIQNFKDREAELEAARELAEKAELKQSFLANISHEIRTPLNAIVGFSNLLTSDVELNDEEKKDYTDTINRNCDLLLNLINDILELSRLESDQMPFNCEKYSVSALIDDVYSTHELSIPQQLAFIKENSNRNIDIYVDKGRLTQVLGNLIDNATKFTQSGYIKIGYQTMRQEVCIFVEDTGKGITKEEQELIFNRFHKLDEFAQGTGLGLSICKAIIEKLNGKINLYSEPDKGSRFEIILPIV